MKNIVRVTLASTSILLATAPAAAQTFPADVEWTPLTRNGVPLGDPAGDAPAGRDVVGDAQNPAAYIASDGAHMFFRLRMNDPVLQSAPSTFKNFGWACLLDTDEDLLAYELVSGVHGKASPNAVELRKNETQSVPDDPTDAAETLLATYPVTTHARQMPAGSTFSGHPDYFIDWAVALPHLHAEGVSAETPFRVVCGTSNNGANLGADLLTDTGATTLTALGGDSYLCGATGCVACLSQEACGPSCSACEAGGLCNTQTGTCEGGTGAGGGGEGGAAGARGEGGRGGAGGAGGAGGLGGAGGGGAGGAGGAGGLGGGGSNASSGSEAGTGTGTGAGGAGDEGGDGLEEALFAQGAGCGCRLEGGPSEPRHGLVLFALALALAVLVARPRLRRKAEGLRGWRRPRAATRVRSAATP